MDMMNRSVIDEVRVDRVVHTGNTDDGQAMLAVKYETGLSKDPEAPNKYHRFHADANGSDDSKLICFLDIGESSTDYTNYQFSAYATGVTDPGGVDSSPTHAQCTTLKAMIDAMNAIEGVTAYELHALTSFSLDSANFIDVSSTDLSHNFFSEVLYQDISATFATAMRVGIPEVRDSGRMRLLALHGTLTGATSGTIKIYRDDHAATEPVLLQNFAMVNSTETRYINDNMTDAATYRGPLVIVAASSDMSACDIKLKTTTAEW